MAIEGAETLLVGRDHRRDPVDALVIRRVGYAEPDWFYTINDFFFRITEPALRPIRNMLPNFGGIDISPLVLLALLWVIQELLARMAQASIFGTLRPLFI